MAVGAGQRSIIIKVLAEVLCMEQCQHGLALGWLKLCADCAKRGSRSIQCTLSVDLVSVLYSFKLFQ